MGISNIIYIYTRIYSHRPILIIYIYIHIKLKAS